MRKSKPQSAVPRTKCPVCGKLLIEPTGRPSNLLIVGDFPSYDDVVEGVPFSKRKSEKDKMRSGDILKKELLRVGLMMEDFRLTHLWQHAHDKKKEVCDPDWHVNELVKEFEGKTHVLLMGSDVTMALLGEKVQAHSGLPVKIKSYKDIRFWVAPNPSLAFKSPLGELRLALERFAEDVNKKKK